MKQLFGRSTQTESERRKRKAMKYMFNRSTGVIGKALWGAALLVALLGAPNAMHAQSATLFGALSNFDVLNNVGQETFGFEIEIDGVTGIGGTFNYNRY